MTVELVFQNLMNFRISLKKTPKSHFFQLLKNCTTVCFWNIEQKKCKKTKNSLFSWYFGYFGPAQQCDFVFSLFAKNAFTTHICTFKVIITGKNMILVTIVTRVFTFSKICDFFYNSISSPQNAHKNLDFLQFFSLFSIFFCCQCENGFHEVKKTKPR